MHPAVCRAGGGAEARDGGCLEAGCTQTGGGRARTSAPARKPPAEQEIVEVTEIIDDEPDDVVEIADGDDAETPARKGKRRAAKGPLLKRFPTWMLLTGGGVALLVLVLGCGGVAWLALSLFGGPSITKDNYDKIKMGSSEKDVTAVMGQPNSSIEDIAKAAGSTAAVDS